MRTEFRQRPNRTFVGPSTWDSPKMGELSETCAELVACLHRMRAGLAARGDVAGADQVLNLMMATVAADEIVCALAREDAARVKFHADLLHSSLESAGPIRFGFLG